MTKFFYSRLAIQNMKQNAQTYIPYIITCICAVAMYYIVFSLSRDPAATGNLAAFLEMGTWIIGIFSVGFLFYTNSFLMKRRKQEFGLFNVLGMEKRHIARIVCLENIFTFLLAIVLGLAFGLLFSKLAHLAMLALLEFDFRYGFSISWQGMRQTLVLFAAIFLLLLLSSFWQLGRARPIELIQGAKTGEKEPKARWFLALLGVVALGGGYWISITTENPILVVNLFFVAVLLVIFGTYLLFMAGGVSLLKLLRRNKHYYYQPNHFISVSGMIYRMKQNAGGLATICILATMVLVMISSTAALYFGMEDAMETRYPHEFIIQVSEAADEQVMADVQQSVNQTLAHYNLQPESPIGYRVMSVSGYRQGDEIFIDGSYDLQKEMVSLCFIPLADYIAFSGEELALAGNNALLLRDKNTYGSPTLTVLGQTFQVQEQPLSFTPFSVSTAYNTDLTPVYFLVMPDIATMETLQSACRAIEGGPWADIYYQFGFDLDADNALQQEIGEAVSQNLTSLDHDFYLESRAANRNEFLMLYGGLFFLGIFLTFVFLLATVLIIYYKQISEGYEDRQRYDIMQKVGLSHREAKRAINSQILTMFFLPLIMACVHIAFAFPAITRMLLVLNLQNTGLFIVSTILSVIVFALFYVAVYGLTAKVYYRLVEARRI